MTAYIQTLHMYSLSNWRFMNDKQFCVNHLVTEINFITEIDI